MNTAADDMIIYRKFQELGKKFLKLTVYRHKLLG